VSEGRSLTNPNVDIPDDPIKLLGAKKDIIARFIGVIVPIMNLYPELSPASVHIFYTLTGSTVTFNRNGSIFLSLRYYEMRRTHPFLSLCDLRSSGFKQMMIK
jgi:hypothetical protein